MVRSYPGYFTSQLETEKWGFERRFGVADSREFWPFEWFSTLKEARQGLSCRE